MIKINARFRLIFSMVVFGTIGLFVRNIAITSGELAFYRATMATLILGGYLYITKQKIPIKEINRETGLLFVSGVAMGFNWIFLFQAYRYTTISLATLSYYFAPVIVTLVCPILFKEKLHLKQWLCFIMSTFGLILITGIGDISERNINLVGILFGLSAAALYATVILLNKFIKNVDGIYRTFLQFVAAVLVLFPYVMFTSGFSLQNLNFNGWIYLIIVGIFHTGFNYCLYFSSIKELSGQKAAILSYIDPFVAVMLSILLLGESMTVLQVLGGIFILGFTLYNEL